MKGKSLFPFPFIRPITKLLKMNISPCEDSSWIKREILSKGDIIYYREGVTDPDYCVLKFTAEKGRYYCDLKNESFTIEELT